MSRLDGRRTRGRLTGSPRRVSGVELFQVLCQSLGPMQIRRGPPPTCSPAADCGPEDCSSDPTPPPTRRSPPASHQSVTTNTTTTNTTHPSTTGRTQGAGPGAQAWCLDPGLALGPGLGTWADSRLALPTPARFCQSALNLSPNSPAHISFVGCRRPIATTLPSQNIAASA